MFQKASVRAVYEASYSWMRETYGSDTDAAGQMCLTKETQAAKTSFINRFSRFTGWVNTERYLHFLDKRFKDIPF